MRERPAHLSVLTNGLAALLVFATAFVAFGPAANNAFVNWDDYANLRDNSRFRGFGSQQFAWMFTALHFGQQYWLNWRINEAVRSLSWPHFGHSQSKRSASISISSFGFISCPCIREMSLGSHLHKCKETRGSYAVDSPSGFGHSSIRFLNFRTSSSLNTLLLSECPIITY